MFYFSGKKTDFFSYFVYILDLINTYNKHLKLKLETKIKTVILKSAFPFFKLVRNEHLSRQET